MKVLILANSRFKGGLSGSDAIYENFSKHWPCETSIKDLQRVHYGPFLVCYLDRLLRSIIDALFDPVSYDMVYSASDFLPDVIPGLIHKARGRRWVAGFYLKAFRSNRIHYCSQAVVRWFISKFADMVIVTNPTMYEIFPDKKKTWINGGVDLELAGLSDKPKVYDAVFCGRIHPSKGIDELIEIWGLVRKQLPKARLAVIGDGDLGKEYIRKKVFQKYGSRIGIDLLGYMGNERYEIYKRSKIVLYPTPLKYDHFSMAPVEAMACGCPLICFENPSNLSMVNIGCFTARNNEEFFQLIMVLMCPHSIMTEHAIKFAQQFDYKKQVIRVWEDINKEIYEDSNNRIKRHDGNSLMPKLI